MTRRIASTRIFLRELEAADCSSDYVAWLADPDINRYLETRHGVHDAESVAAFVEHVRAKADEFLFGIFLNDSSRHVGNIKVGPIHPYHRVADLSLFVGARDCWGRGIAAEAITALSRYAFAQLGVEKLSASMYAPNVGSRRAFLKAGYRDEGIRRAHYRLGAERCDVYELGLLAADLGIEP